MAPLNLIKHTNGAEKVIKQKAILREQLYQHNSRSAKREQRTNTGNKGVCKGIRQIGSTEKAIVNRQEVRTLVMSL